MESSSSASIRRRLQILGNALLNSSYDDAESTLAQLYNFIIETPILIGFIERQRDREYSKDEVFAKRNWGDRHRLPPTTAGRIGFTWSMIQLFVTRDQGSRMEYWHMANHYGGNSKTVSDHIRPFHEAIIIPFLQLLEDHLIEVGAISQSLPQSITIGSVGGSVQIMSNSPYSRQEQSISALAHELEDLSKEILTSAYSDKEQLQGLISILREHPAEQMKNRGFLRVCIERLKDYNAIVAGSVTAPKIIEILTGILS